MLYAELPARAEIFAPIRRRCETLPIDKYPESVKVILALLVIICGLEHILILLFCKLSRDKYLPRT